MLQVQWKGGNGLMCLCTDNTAEGSISESSKSQTVKWTFIPHIFAHQSSEDERDLGKRTERRLIVGDVCCKLAPNGTFHTSVLETNRVLYKRHLKAASVDSV